ncbi:MAG: VanZ family protein [Hyphomonadaceae bacterium]|nr:VanZ family protein [Clostridia bacterium]
MKLVTITIKKVAYMAWASVLSWCIVIFAFSAQIATDSDRFSKGFAWWVFRDSLTNSQIREFAHGTIYLVLAVLVVNAYRISGYNKRNAYAYTMLFCILYAWTDEIHQIFVPGRAAEFIDFSIDFTGATIGLLVYILFEWMQNTILTCHDG